MIFGTKHIQQQLLPGRTQSDAAFRRGKSVSPNIQTQFTVWGQKRLPASRQLKSPQNMISRTHMIDNLPQTEIKRAFLSTSQLGKYAEPGPL